MEIELTNVTQIINMIKEMSPAVWEVYLQQVWLDGMVALSKALVWTLAMLPAALFLFVGGKLTVQEFKGDSRKFDGDRASIYLLITCLSTIASIVFVVCAVRNITYALQLHYNPSYYAIQLLLETIR